MPLISNPFAPPAFEGIVNGSADFDGIPGTYQFQVTLTALQNLPGQIVQIDTSSDFECFWMQIVAATSSGFTFVLQDNFNMKFSNAPLPAVATMNAGAFAPFVFVPPLTFPAGGFIGLDLVDTSGATNTIQIVFWGRKKIPVNR